VLMIETTRVRPQILMAPQRGAFAPFLRRIPI